LKRKSIVIYYALAILLPCLVLGILAFRGIKNDQALVEREQMQKLRETGQEIVQVTEGYLSTIEKGFVETIDAAVVPRETLFSDSSLHQFHSNYPAVSGIFYRSVSGTLMLLNDGLLYLSDELYNVFENDSYQVTNQILENCWKYEFVERNYQKSLEYYQNNLANITDEHSAGKVWNAIARVQKKLGEDYEAIKTYQLIWNTYPQIYIQKKIPLGAVALVEISSLNLKQSDTISAAQNIYLLTQKIRDKYWKLSYYQYVSFLEKIDEIIVRCEDSSCSSNVNWFRKIQQLKDSIVSSQKQTEYLLTFLHNNEIFSNYGEPDWPDNRHRYKFQVNGESYFISLSSGTDHDQWGMILDHDYLLHHVIQPYLLSFESETNTLWEVSGANGQTLLKSKSVPENTLPVYIAFPSDLPTWSLALYRENSSLFASLIHPERSLYLYIFIVILIILSCGLFFTLHTINNEIRLSRLKSQFISTVSHEFKSPLTSIRQMAEMLVRERLSSPEKEKKYHETILQQSERLSHLIDNILDFSKIEEGQKLLRPEFASIAPVVSEVIESLREYTAKKGIRIDLEVVDPIPELSFDREAISQVVHNLIDNAYKYSGDSKNIEVRLYAQGEKVVIAIRDYGIGIRKEEQYKIFSRFYRAGEELTRTVKGSGIGLTIVKQLVDAHQGEILVESSPGIGSTFYVRLPVVQKIAKREKNSDH
jgi:signal transduction histidine kinase